MSREIKVNNCRECPFVTNDNEFGYDMCNVSEEVTNALDTWEELPADKVHDLCPLKTNSIRVLLNNAYENQQVSPACIKPNVGCCTSVNELIQWCVLNAFNIEGRDGIKYVAIDYEEMQSQLDYFVEKEKTQIIDAFTAGQIDIANTFFAEYNKRGFEYKLSIPENDKEDGEKYFDETFKNNGVPV